MRDPDLGDGASPVQVPDLVSAIAKRYRPPPAIGHVAAGAVDRHHMMDDDIPGLHREGDNVIVLRRGFYVRTATFRR